MNDEIKEILSYLKKKENTRRLKCITIEESKHLLDYITNLQQEKEDYKSRCEKAVELLKNKVKVIPFDKNGEGGGIILSDYDIEDLLNILQNGGDSQ